MLVRRSPGDARIPLHLEGQASRFIEGVQFPLPVMGVHHHGAEFHELEAAAVLPHPGLQKEYGSARIELYGQGHPGEDGE
jgi:hypothetical protein